MPSRIGLMKQFDALLGRVGAWCLPAPASRAVVSPLHRILIIRPGGIGDAVLLAPALAALKTTFPAVHLTVLAEHRNAAVFGLCPSVDCVVRYDRPADFISVLRAKYDVVIDTEQWHRLSAVVARLVRAPVKIGYGTNERERLFTNPVAYAQDDYEAQSFFHLFEPLGMVPPAAVTTPFLTVPAAARQRATELLELLDGNQLIAIFPGASIPERRWGAQKFGELARRVAAEGVRAVVVGGAVDEADSRVIAGTDGLPLAGTTTMAETAAIVQRATLLVSGDSGILHLGVGLGIPTVSLFGPGRQRKWGPCGEGHVIINHHLHCSPCTTWGSTPPCPVGARCLAEITVDEVFSAVKRLLCRVNNAEGATKILTRP